MQLECSVAPASTSQSAQELLETLLSITGRVEGFLYRCRNDRDYSMLHISDGVDRLCGYPASDFIDNRVRAFSTVIFAEDLESIYASVDQALAARKNWEIDYRLVHRSGKTVWVHEIGAGVFSPSGELLYLEGFVIDIAHDNRNFDQAGQLRRAPASFSGYDFIAIGRNRTHDHRLNDAVLSDRAGKIVQLGFVEIATGVLRVATDEFDRHHAIRIDAWPAGIHRCRLVHLSDEGGQTAAKAPFRKIIIHRNYSLQNK